MVLAFGNTALKSNICATKNGICTGEKNNKKSQLCSGKKANETLKHLFLNSVGDWELKGM